MSRGRRLGFFLGAAVCLGVPFASIDAQRRALDAGLPRDAAPASPRRDAALEGADLGDAAVTDAPRPAPRTEGTIAVAADHPEASAIGLEILRAGGTAADAAAATMLALGVASPASSGMGGGGFALYYRAADRSLTFLDFRERAPARATTTMYAGATGDANEERATMPSQVGGLAVAVPGEPAGIAELVRRFGRKSLRDIAEPAALLATRGARATAYLADGSSSMIADLSRDPISRRWLRGGRLEAGTPLVNTALARTIRAFGAAGTRGFYDGAIARSIVADVQRRGGILTIDDMRAYRVAERTPLEAVHFGLRWVTAPPESAGGYTLLSGLDFLSRVAPAPQRLRESEYFHALAESWKGPFVDRATYFGDPDVVAIPLAELVDVTRREARASLFVPDRARPANDYALPLAATQVATTVPAGGGTSHLCVVDAEGNVAAVTTTINLLYGARFTSNGVWLNDEMDDFAREVGAPNAFGLPGGAQNLPRAGARPVSTMTPTIVFDADGRPVMCVGASGGSRIVTAVAQVATRVLVRGEHLVSAMTAPRIHHQGMPATMTVEQGFDRRVREELAARGHEIREVSFGANVQAIHIRHGVTPPLVAVSDPRKNGIAAVE